MESSFPFSSIPLKYVFLLVFFTSTTTLPSLLSILPPPTPALPQVRNQRLLERALEKKRLEEAKEAAAVAQAARVLAEERASEARERRTMAQEEE